MSNQFTRGRVFSFYPAGAVNSTVESLCDPASYREVYHRTQHDAPRPSPEKLARIMQTAKSIIFPGYFIDSDIKPETMKYHIGAAVDSLYSDLSEQILRGYCFSCILEGELRCDDCEERSANAVTLFIERLPEIRRLMTLDAKAAYSGDPAAKGIGEAIFCYPSVSALLYHRIAHELYLLDVPIIPRIISEMAHSNTGIDIHPGASIGESFFIDHGTGTVIGETCVIGSGVRIYQGVTLGAKSFPVDDNGHPVKGIPRHPVVEDDVTIYAGATLLGRITVGRGAEIGGNVWITSDIPAGARVSQSKYVERYFNNGDGI